MARRTGQKIPLGKFLPGPFQFLLLFGLVLRVDIGGLGEDSPVALTFRTPTMRAVEGEEAWIELIKRPSGTWTKEVVAVDGGFSLGIQGIEGAFAQGEGLRDEGGKIFSLGGDLVDEEIDLVFLVSIQGLELLRFDPFAIHPQQLKALFDGPTGDLGMEPFAPANQGGQQIEALGGTELASNPLDDIGGRLADGGFPRLGVVLHPKFGIEEPQKLIELRHRGHSGLATSACGALLNGHGGWKSENRIDVRFFQLLDKLPGVGVETIEIAALPFGE